MWVTIVFHVVVLTAIVAIGSATMWSDRGQASGSEENR
jgi:hypothetical protein